MEFDSNTELECMMKKGFVLILFSLLLIKGFCQSPGTFADHWQFIGIAVEEAGYTVWGTSPIVGDDGKTHLFVARWPGSTVEPEWRTESEIAHYVGDTQEGPFIFSDVALTGTGKNTWDKVSVHNPTIHKVGNQYVLLYIGNDDGHQPPHPANQCIGMAVSNSLYGPWKRVGKDGKILSPPDNPRYWDYGSGCGVNNPAFLQHPNGGYFLYFKSCGGKSPQMGLAVAENLEGPYVQLPFPVTSNERTIEDGYAFIYKGKFALLTTDNHGIIEPGGGILWTSSDGIHFDNYEKGFHRINKYTTVDMQKATIHYGPQNSTYAKIERPQVLLINSEPKYLFGGSGCNIYGGPSPVSYVLKFKK